MPRAVLAGRLKTLIAAGVMTRVAGERHLEYELTGKGTALWPVVLSLMSWGDDFCAPGGPRRLFRHAADGGQVDRWGQCDACCRPVPAADTIIAPGPGLEPPADDDSWVNHRADQAAPAAGALARGRRSRGSLTGRGLPDAPPSAGEGSAPIRKAPGKDARQRIVCHLGTRTPSRAQFGELTQDQQPQTSITCVRLPGGLSDLPS